MTTDDRHGRVSTPELAAVSNAGRLGSIALGATPREAMLVLLLERKPAAELMEQLVAE